MKANQLRNSFLLLITAIIWGVAFVAQSVAMDYIGGFTFTCSRSILGGFVLIPIIILFRDKEEKIDPKEAESCCLGIPRIEWIGGICCGIALCAASNFQQYGVKYTTVGKAGFITALYVVIVPILGIFLKKRVSVCTWLSVGLSVIGLYMLCMTDGSFALSLGDSLVMICAFLFSVHILVIDHFSPLCNGIRISCIQFFVCGILSAVLMFLFETPDWASVLEAWIPIAYAGIMSSGVAYTLQIVGQKDLNPTIASLIMCLESVVSAIAGWIILHQALSLKEIAGCCLMFAAIIIAQIWGEAK